MSHTPTRDPLAEYEDARSPEAVAKKKAFDLQRLKKVIWVTAQMAKNIDRDLYLATNAREIVFYIVFVVCITVAALGVIDPTMYFMTQAFRAQMVDHAGIPYPETQETSKVKFYDITTVDEMWDYLEVHLLPLLYPEVFEMSKERDKGIGSESVLIGVPVIRQVMVMEIQCPDPFPSIFEYCYPKYSKSAMSNQQPDGFEWPYETTQDTKGATWNGRAAKYYGDGFQEELGRSMDDANETLQKLKSKQFIQKGTRAIFLDVSYYNAHVNLFTAVKIAFELPPTGGIIPSAIFYTMRMPWFVTIKDYLILAAQILYMILIVFYVFEEVRELFFLRKHYFHQFWNYVDLVVIGSAVALIVCRMKEYFEVKTLLYDIEQAVDKYHSLQSITNTEMTVRNAFAIAIFTAYFKLFKYLSFNGAMYEIHQALNKSLRDIAALLFMLAIVLVGFAMFGCLAFGTRLWDFSTFFLSLFALFRILLTDISYDSLYEADDFMSIVFYVLFIGVILFILLNLFIAIVYDCYGDVKMETAILPQEKHMTDFWRAGIYNLMHRCRCGACVPKGLIRKRVQNKTIEDIKIGLKRCGFSDLDIEMFLNRYNIDPDARVRTWDVDKLLENLKTEVPPKPERTGLTQEPPLMPAYAVESAKPGSQTRREEMTSRTPMVTTKDFQAQQDRLDKVEGIMASIAEKLDILLKKVNAFDARKMP